ncbi:MAG TPA: hypothetical protein GX708_23395 [Gallicola sp.]|nr:hypothetical protein [Gallicola sp.]
MDQYQYRITVNQQQGNILDFFPNEQWQRITEIENQRGIDAKLERRLITDTSIFPLLTDPSGYMRLNNNIIVSPWQTIAEFKEV